MTTKELRALIKEQDITSSELFTAINQITSEKIAKYLLDAQIEKITFPKHLPLLQISYLNGNNMPTTKEIHSISLLPDNMIEINIVSQLLTTAQVIVSLSTFDIIPQTLERVYEALIKGDLNQHIQYQRAIEMTKHNLSQLQTEVLIDTYKASLKERIIKRISPYTIKTLEKPIQIRGTQVDCLTITQYSLKLNETNIPWSDLNTQELEQILLSLE